MDKRGELDNSLGYWTFRVGYWIFRFYILRFYPVKMKMNQKKKCRQVAGVPY